MRSDGARRAASRGRLPHASAGEIGDFTDFFAGIHHATNSGRLLRPDNPLLPNYKYIPIGYHGRASSIGASGAEVRRPNGQRKPRGESRPELRSVALSRLRARARRLHRARQCARHADPDRARRPSHIAGFCLLNDWSARDIQAWEYQPLGPFLGKSFATTVSPWVVTPEALAPFRIAQAPRPGRRSASARLSDGRADQRAARSTSSSKF